MLLKGKDAEEGRDFPLHTYIHTHPSPCMHGQGRLPAEGKVR